MRQAIARNISTNVTCRIFCRDQLRASWLSKSSKNRGFVLPKDDFAVHLLPFPCLILVRLVHISILQYIICHDNTSITTPVKYRQMPDGQNGWFLPNDDLKYVEHPEEGAKGILREQAGIEPSTLKLAQIESFVGNDKSWHLVFDFLAFPLSMKVTKAPSLLDAQWFEMDKLPPASEFAHHGWGHSALLKLAKARF